MLTQIGTIVKYSAKPIKDVYVRLLINTLSVFSEIPVWLRVYFKASSSLDHHLKWDLFPLTELECYESMLTRLFKDELEELVMRYDKHLFRQKLWII